MQDKPRTPLTVAANHEPSGCGTTLSIADDDVIAVLSARGDESESKASTEGRHEAACDIPVGST